MIFQKSSQYLYRCIVKTNKQEALRGKRVKKGKPYVVRGKDRNVYGANGSIVWAMGFPKSSSSPRAVVGLQFAPNQKYTSPAFCNVTQFMCNKQRKWICLPSNLSLVLVYIPALVKAESLLISRPQRKDNRNQPVVNDSLENQAEIPGKIRRGMLHCCSVMMSVYTTRSRPLELVTALVYSHRTTYSVLLYISILFHILC